VRERRQQRGVQLLAFGGAVREGQIVNQIDAVDGCASRSARTNSASEFGTWRLSRASRATAIIPTFP